MYLEFVKRRLNKAFRNKVSCLQRNFTGEFSLWKDRLSKKNSYFKEEKRKLLKLLLYIKSVYGEENSTIFSRFSYPQK